MELAYTAVLPAREHPSSEKSQLIKDLYDTPEDINESIEALLANKKRSYLSYELNLMGTDEIALLHTMLEKGPLPKGLEPTIAKAVLNSLFQSTLMFTRMINPYFCYQ